MLHISTLFMERLMNTFDARQITYANQGSVTTYD